MNLLPKASGTRPRVACEITPQGAIAARSGVAAGPLAAVSRAALDEGAVTPSLKPGNVVDRVAVAAAVRKALESIGLRPNSRGSDITLVVPDGAVRVLLLEFDALSNKLSEALPIVRFRLKKLLPFDADDAMVTFQVMSTSKQMVRVLAVAIPRDVLSEYETAVREAGFEPGAVIPSTLAAIAAVEDESPRLIVNANTVGVTTAIVRGPILLLHRSVDLQAPAAGLMPNLPPALFDIAAPLGTAPILPLVDLEDTAGEWAMQEALPEHGRNPYAAAAVQDSPYTSPLLMSDLSAELHYAALTVPTSVGTLTEDASGHDIDEVDRLVDKHVGGLPPRPPSIAVDGDGMGQDPLSSEIAQAVNVAAAYFEDTLAVMPEVIVSAGSMGAESLRRILAAEGVVQTDGLRVRELVGTEDLLSEAVTASVPRSCLSGVLGALRG
jgi:type IV pilus assembly protein PilM